MKSLNPIVKFLLLRWRWASHINALMRTAYDSINIVDMLRWVDGSSHVKEPDKRDDTTRVNKYYFVGRMIGDK